MIADISFLEARIEEKYNAARKKLRTQKRTPLYTFLALAIMITGTLGGYLSLSQAATATRRAPLVFQGRITDANYVPVADTSSRRMIFRIWSSSDTSAASDGGGTCAWSTGNNDGGATNSTGEGLANCGLAASASTLTSDAGLVVSVPVTITRGVFSIPLGDTAFDSGNRMPVMSQAFDNQSSEVYYVEIFVQNDSGTYERLSPRIRIGAASYAYNADELDGLNSLSFFRADQTAATSGTPTANTYTAAAHTDLANAEATDVNFNLARTINVTGGGADIAAHRSFLIQAPTFTADAAQRITTASTLAIEGPPVEGNSAMDFDGRTPLWIRGTNHTWGALLFVNYPSTTTMASTVDDPNWVLGANYNLTGLTATGSTTGGTGGIVTGQLIDGNLISLPAVTSSTNDGTVTVHGIRVTSGALNATGTGIPIVNWYGARITMPNITQSAGTVTSRGMYIEGGTVASGTAYALVTDRTAGNVGIGDPDQTPDATLELSTALGNQNAFAMSSDNVSHSITNIQQNDMFYRVDVLESGGVGTGGAEINGISDNFDATGLQLRGIIGPVAVNPTDTVPALSLVGAKGHATAANPTELGAAETVLQILNDDTALATILGSGNVGIGDTTPDSLLEISATAAQNASIALSGSGDMNHGITTPITGGSAITQGDMFLKLGTIDSSGGAGGGTVIGLSDDAGTAGLYLGGIIGVAIPTNSTSAVIVRGSRRNGTTATTTTLDDAGTLLTVENDALIRMTVLGNGNMGLGNGITPATKLDVSGDLALRIAAFTASNGENNNSAIGASSFIRLTGPTAAFTITGIAGGVNGKMVIIYNPTGSNMTIAHQSASSTEANRIITMTGLDVVTTGNGSAVLMYSSSDSRWILISVEQ